MLLLGLKNTLASIGIWIVSGIYKVAAFAFQLFIILADGEIVSAESYKNVIDNAYLVLGIVLLFILAFSLLKGMVNPEDQKQGTSNVKKVIVNLITSAIIMAVLPTVFTFAYDFQHSVISKYNVLGKFFGYGSLGTSEDSPTSESNMEDVKSGAYTIVNGVFTAFFNVNMDSFCIPSELTEDEKQYGTLIACQNKVKSDSSLDFGENYADYGAKSQKDNQTLYAAINYVGTHGNFNLYNSFSEQVEDEKVDFNFLLSLIGGLILIYVAVSFCFDMALRMIKLVFYQLIAPIPIFFRVVPDGKLGGTFNKWLKVTFTCYFEVYVRIFAFYFCIFLCNQILAQGFFEQVSTGYGTFLGLLAKAFVLMGLVMFMKQAPKLIADATGLDSGNMKLGIREKLRDGGLFTAGAVAGGALTAGVRNATNAIANGKNKWNGSTAKEKAGLIAKGIGSTVAGTLSGGARSGKAGWGAKSEKDMISAASSGASAAVNARDKRTAYKADHGNAFFWEKYQDEQGETHHKLGGAIGGHVTDTIKGVEEWAGIGISDAAFSYYTAAAQQSNSFNDLSESTYKKKQEYMDQNSIVKALEARVAPYKEYTNQISKLEKEREQSADENRKAEISQKINELKQARTTLNLDSEWNKYTTEAETLRTMQKTMAAKKADVISIAATQLSANQRANYSQDKEFVDAYRKAIFEGFGVDKLDYQNSKIKQVEVTLSDGTVEKRDQRIFIDENGKEIGKLSVDETSILDAMLNGGEVKDEWIKKDNVIKVQDAIDKANIGRQHIKTQKERAHILRTANRTSEKKDKK